MRFRVFASAVLSAKKEAKKRGEIAHAGRYEMRKTGMLMMMMMALTNKWDDKICKPTPNPPNIKPLIEWV